MTRQELSNQFAHGIGLEIAPLHFPWPLNSTIKKIDYVDLFSLNELKKRDPHLDIRIDPNYLEDGSILKSFKNNKLDFVFSSHVLEHCPNAIEAIRNWLRVLKKNGNLIMAIPLQTNWLDKNRKVTDIRHFAKEFIIPHKVELNYESHYREYFKNNSQDQLQGDDLEAKVQAELKTKNNIHFHVWSEKTLEFFFRMLINKTQSFTIEHFEKNGDEMFVVLKKVQYTLDWYSLDWSELSNTQN